MKKIFILFLGILLLSLIQPTSAYFFKDHQYFVLKSFEEVDSPLTQQCRPFIEAVINGVEAADVGVLHYFDDKVTSYIGTHQRVGYEGCLREAGSDVESKCFCHGIALHIEMDALSHLDGGIVVEKLKKSLGSNFFGHMVIERSFEKRHQQSLVNDLIITSGQLAFFDARVLNLLFEETGGDPKFLDLLNKAAGIDMETDARVIRSGYLGEGFFGAVYKDKISLPFWVWGIGIGLIILGLAISLVIIIFGNTRWKFLTALFWFAITLIGVIITISFITGTTWQITTTLIELPASVGYLAVSDQEVKFYNEKLLENSIRFLETEQLSVDDASGLSFVDKNGVFHEGALTKASVLFRLILLPIILLSLMILNIWMFLKSFKIRTPKILNFFGWSLLINWSIVILVFLSGMIVGILK